MDFQNMELEQLYAIAFRKNGSVVKELASTYSPRCLFDATLPELKEIKGIGEGHAKQIIALIELSRRAITSNNRINEACSGPQDVVSIMVPKMQLLDREHFYVISLNVKNRILSIDNTAIGILSSAICHPREIFKRAIRLNAFSLILVHNHPSGIPDPSSEDFDVTKRIVEVGKVVGIKVLDHIIVGTNFNYYSFKDRGHIQ